MDVKKRVLIWNNYPLKKRSGGSSTYLYNLKNSITTHNIDFLNDYKVEKSSTKIFWSWWSGSTIQKLYLKIKPYTWISYFFRSKYKKEMIKYCKQEINVIPNNIKLESYDYIHFHNTITYYRNRFLLKQFSGKTILTSHNPKPMHQEMKEIYNIISSEKQDFLRKIDEFAFINADYIIFPCKESQESYIKNWPKYSEIKFKNKIQELLTSGINPNITNTKEEIYAKYKIPDNSFVVTYIGRHIKIKGYDILKKSAEIILKKFDNVYFLIAGHEGPLYRLKHKRWIEVGWTNTPYSFINASDLFVLPNRDTYFDLSLLEVLSVGIPVAISYTGGNKFFKRLPTEYTRGIIFFKPDDIADLVEKVEFVYLNNIIGNKNKELFNKYFDNKHFATNYISLIESLD